MVESAQSHGMTLLVPVHGISLERHVKLGFGVLATRA